MWPEPMSLRRTVRPVGAERLERRDAREELVAAPRRSRPWDRCTPSRRAARPGERARRRRARSRAAVPASRDGILAHAPQQLRTPPRRSEAASRARRRGRGRRSRPRAAVAARRARSSTEPSSTARPGSPIRAALRSWTSPATTRPSAPTSEAICGPSPPAPHRRRAPARPAAGRGRGPRTTLAWSWTAKRPTEPGQRRGIAAGEEEARGSTSPGSAVRPRPRRAASSAAGSSARRLSGAWAARASAAAGASSPSEPCGARAPPRGQAGAKAQGRVVVPHGPGRPFVGQPSKDRVDEPALATAGHRDRLAHGGVGRDSADSSW